MVLQADKSSETSASQSPAVEQPTEAVSVSNETPTESQSASAAASSQPWASREATTQSVPQDATPEQPQMTQQHGGDEQPEGLRQRGSAQNASETPASLLAARQVLYICLQTVAVPAHWTEPLMVCQCNMPSTVVPVQHAWHCGWLLLPRVHATHALFLHSCLLVLGIGMLWFHWCLPCCYDTSKSSKMNGDTLTSVCSGGRQSQQSISNIFSRRSAHDWEDLGLTVLAVLLSLLIAAIVLRKIVTATGGAPDVTMETDLASFE